MAEKRLVSYELVLRYAGGNPVVVSESHAPSVMYSIPVSVELANDLIARLAADVYNEWGL